MLLHRDLYAGIATRDSYCHAYADPDAKHDADCFHDTSVHCANGHAAGNPDPVVSADLHADLHPQPNSNTDGHADADTVGDTHVDADTQPNVHGDGDGNADANRFSDRHSNGDSDTNGDSDCHTYRHTYANRGYADPNRNDDADPQPYIHGDGNSAAGFVIWPFLCATHSRSCLWTSSLS